VFLLWSWFKFMCVTANMKVAKSSCDVKHLSTVEWCYVDCRLVPG